MKTIVMGFIVIFCAIGFRSLAQHSNRHRSENSYRHEHSNNSEKNHNNYKTHNNGNRHNGENKYKNSEVENKSFQYNQHHKEMYYQKQHAHQFHSQNEYYTKNNHYRNGAYHHPNPGMHNQRLFKVGHHVDVLPFGYNQVIIGPTTYYHCGGVFYLRHHKYNFYTVAEPPVGALLYELPYGTEEVYINGYCYLEYNGILFRRIYTHHGDAFEVVGRI